ncbi:MAG: AraC family transcriptional regulator [Bacteroidales bacterium]|nr:AraC family transcriptional regulator [Bacteroidales bacterium]
MYKLSEFFESVMNVQLPTNCGIFCSRTDKGTTFMTNRMIDTLACYTFTLVTNGWLIIGYNGREILLQSGDLYIYTPGFRISILDASSDYQAYCLLAEENVTFEMHTVRNLLRSAYFPIIELQEPKLKLSETEAAHFVKQMKNIIDYQESAHTFKTDCLVSLYSIFLLDLMDVQQKNIRQHKYSERTEELFIGFASLLPRHFIEHHDIAFYANQLSITPTYLSRIVRGVTGRTVVDYINQMLMMEAIFLLQTSRLSVSQIADQLHFADISSFSKFFLRINGSSPRTYRAVRNSIR